MHSASAVGDDDPNGEDTGATYVFEAAGEDWFQQAKLAPWREDCRFAGSEPCASYAASMGWLIPAC